MEVPPKAGHMTTWKEGENSAQHSQGALAVPAICSPNSSFEG